MQLSNNEISTGFFIFIWCNPLLENRIYPDERIEMIIKLDQSMSEQQLLVACKKNDRKAQRVLFDLHAPVMLSVCRRYMHDTDLAEELMLQGFMKAFEKIDQYKSEGSLQGWIRKIMVNTCLGWIRKNKKMYKEVDLDNVKEIYNEEALEGLLEAEDLMKLIQDLPQGYRTIFNLYAIEGFTHDEIAEKLNISSGTSKSQLSRARKFLQGQLAIIETQGQLRKQQDGK